MLICIKYELIHKKKTSIHWGCVEKSVAHKKSVYWKGWYLGLKCYFQNFLKIFLCGFCFINIHFPQDSRGRGRTFLIALYHLQPLHGYLYINRAITAETSPLHTVNGHIQTGKTRSICKSGSKLSYAHSI